MTGYIARTATEIVEPDTPMRMCCPFGHEWHGTCRVERDHYETRRQGHRPFYKYHYIYEPERCPICGHKVCSSKPR